MENKNSEWGKARAAYKAIQGRERLAEVMRPGNKKNILKGQIRLAKKKKEDQLQENWRKNPSTGKGVGY